MSHASFFGYGSLVNLATHVYENPRAATAQGWSRAWLHTDARPFAYLSAVPEPDGQIHGVVADVPGQDWTALDAREAGYERCVLADFTAIYAIPEQSRAKPSVRHPILLSYLDVVLQGYDTLMGSEGIAHFCATTSGWDAPILNDRAAPKYPRAQVLIAEETRRVDEALAQLGCTVIAA